MTLDATITLIYAFITSKMDNLNGLIYGVPDFQLDKLPLIQYYAARLIMRKIVALATSEAEFRQ